MTTNEKILSYVEKKYGLKNAEKELGLSTNYLVKVVQRRTDRGKHTSMRVDTAIKLADLLNCSLDELVGRERT